MLTKEERIRRRTEGLKKHYLTHKSILIGRKQTKEHIEARRKAMKGTKKPSLSIKYKGSGNPNWKGGKVKNLQAGRTRAEVMFSCPKGKERHHIDGNPLNNNPENVEFLTRKEHMKKDGRLERLIKRNKGLL